MLVTPLLSSDKGLFTNVGSVTSLASLIPITAIVSSAWEGMVLSHPIEVNVLISV